MLRQYFNRNEILEIFTTSFCNILCYVGNISNNSCVHCVDVFFCVGLPKTKEPKRFRLPMKPSGKISSQ